MLNVSNFGSDALLLHDGTVTVNRTRRNAWKRRSCHGYVAP